MPSFDPCGLEVIEMAALLLKKYETHAPLLAAKVKVDFVFAYGDRDENGELKNCALTKNGAQALGICRKIPAKDRAMGRGDAEIALDGDYWRTASEEERAALLDHELHHIAVCMTGDGVIQTDQQGRPKLSLRKHDFEVGWFHVIAHRHGKASIERHQAAMLMESCGQLYWPDLVAADGAQKSRVQHMEVAH